MSNDRRDGGLEKRGGYSGSKPATSMRPPARVPSAAIKPPLSKPADKAR